MSPPTVETKTRPILFSAPMIRAILDGTKTMTRRIIRRSNSLMDGGPWPASARLHLSTAIVDRGPSPAGNPGPYLNHVALSEGWGDTFHRIYSRVQIGDLWWVREGFAYCPKTYRSSGIIYRADGEDNHVMTFEWRPSIFMPRAASRITLEVTEVRPERVQDISADDAWSEGIIPESGVGSSIGPIPQFEIIWDTINKKPADIWAADPWIWCYTFRRVKP